MLRSPRYTSDYAKDHFKHEIMIKKHKKMQNVAVIRPWKGYLLTVPELKQKRDHLPVQPQLETCAPIRVLGVSIWGITKKF